MDHLFFVSLVKIIWIDVLLSGDNALVIALACAHLPRHQRLVAMIAGTVLAVALRIACTGSAAYLMQLPYLKISGGAVLVYIAAKLLVPENNGDDTSKRNTGMAGAIISIVLADISMSIDNILAVAAAAAGDIRLLAIGLVLSIPLVVVGASIISAIINKVPILVWAGAALLGWIAGETIATDPLLAPYVTEVSIQIVGALGIVLVLLVGIIWRRLVGINYNAF